MCNVTIIHWYTLTNIFHLGCCCHFIGYHLRFISITHTNPYISLSFPLLFSFSFPALLCCQCIPAAPTYLSPIACTDLVWWQNMKKSSRKTYQCKSEALVSCLLYTGSLITKFSASFELPFVDHSTWTASTLSFMPWYPRL